MKSTASKKTFDTQSSELLKKITAGSYGDPTGIKTKSATSFLNFRLTA